MLVPTRSRETDATVGGVSAWTVSLVENFHAMEPKDGGAVSPPLPYLTIAASPHIMAKSYGKLGGAPGWTRGREPHPCAFTCVSPSR
jgi:hypothetical protein